MRNAYRILAIIIAVEVVIQAMAMVFAVAGLGIWVDDGGVLDKAAFESEDLSFTGVVGFMVHGINGMMIIPLLGLALLVVSFFAKVPGGVKWAAIVLGSIVVQVLAGIFGHDVAVHRHAPRPERLHRCSARRSTPRGWPGRPTWTTPTDRRCVTQDRPEPVRQLLTAAGAVAADRRGRGDAGHRAAAGLDVAGQPDARRVLGHGHGVRRRRRRARLDGHARHHGGHAGHGQRRRPRRGHRPAGRRGRRADRPPGARSRWRRAARSTATPSTARPPGRRSRPPRATWSRSACTTTTSTTASACTGTASTSRTPRTASPASPRTRSARARTTSTGSSSTTPAPTGTTPTRSPTSRCSAVCSGPRRPSARPDAGDARRPRRHPHLRRSRTLNGEEGDDRRRRARRPACRVRVVNTDNGAVPVWSIGAVPGARRRRPRRQRPDAGRRRAGRPCRPAAAYDLEVTAPRARRRSAARPRSSSATTPAPAAAARADDARPADLRRARRRCRSTRPTPDRTFRLLHRPATRLPRRQARALVDDQRPPVPGRPDVPRRRGRRRRHARSRTTAARCTRCTCTATTRSCSPATASRPPAARGGSTRSTSRTTRPIEIAFVADNPGIWMDHCHNLKHAAQGLVAHLMYTGVTEPYRLGDDSGNEPE